MKFLLQIFAPFKEAYYRYIHLFFCTVEGCKMKSITAIRTQLPFNNQFFDKSEKMIGEDVVRWSEVNQQYLFINQVKEIVSLPLEQDENQEINKNIHDLEALLQEDDLREEGHEESMRSENDMVMEEISESENEEEEQKDYLEKDIDFIIFKKNI